MPSGYTPVYKILKDGNDITDNFNDRTTEIKIELKGGGGDSDICQITIDDRDWRVAAIETGEKIEVYLGYKEIGYAQQGIFEVDTVEYEISPRQIKIVGNATGFTGALKAPKIQNYENKTLGEIIGSIADGKGVSSYISPELAKEKIPFVNQITSPLHLMHELERRFGAVAKFENNRLVFAKRDEGESTDGIEMPVLVLRPENVSTGAVRHSERGNFSGAKVGWIDADHQKRYVEEKGQGESEAPMFLSGKIGRSETEARAMAKSQVAALRRSMGEARLTLSKGNPWVRDQMRILLQAFRDKVDGSYVSDTVTHTYTKAEGILTEIQAKPPGTGEDFSSLDDGEFYKLGTGGVVGEFGPQMPDPNADAGLDRPDVPDGPEMADT